MLVIGVRTLNFSAEVALQDLEEPADRGNSGKEKVQAPTRGQTLRVGLTVVFALSAGVAVFFIVPLILTTSLFDVRQDPARFNLISGAIRITLLLAYLGAISTMKDVRRLFAYHGAEHKAVFAFERGESLDLTAAERQSRFHPRCGTSFLLLVVLVSIAMFAALDALVMHWAGELNLGVRLATHLPLIPLIGGAAYECIRLSARHGGTALGRSIAAPGLWLQHITTREPAADQIEVALTALRAALGIDESDSHQPVKSEAMHRDA
jgi:uncharacterized protein YqhQ